MTIHDIYHPFLRYFRTRRMRQFQRRFSLTSQSRILDVGGTPYNWSLIDCRPDLTLLNITVSGGRGEADRIVADGTHLPFKDRAFDIVYSNSLIEHLGDFKNQRCFAEEVRRVGRQYYVQTPNRRFPVEPHLLTPFIHWLPVRLQKSLRRRFTIRGLFFGAAGFEHMNDIRLLNEREMRVLFPGAEIWREYFLGFVKSLIAVRI